MTPRRHCAIISLGDVLPHRSMRPTRDSPSYRDKRIHRKTSRLPPPAGGFIPAWSCSQRGLPGHPYYYRCRWSLTPPFHHDPAWRGCLFLWPLSGRLAPCGGSPPRMLSDAVLYGVRTFLDGAKASPRSPNRPEATSSYTYEKRASTGIDSLENITNIGEIGKRH